jgi:hypothetical protein
MQAREVIIAAIKRGATNEEALTTAVKKHPRTTISPATVNYLRNQLRKTHPKTVKSDREARRLRLHPRRR